MCVDRKCINCKYVYTSYSDEPCKSCDRHCRSNWVDALTEGTIFDTTVATRKFEMGDLVTIGYSGDVYVYLYDNIVMRVPDDVTIDPPDSTIISLNTAKYSVSVGLGILIRNTNDFLGFTWAAAMDRVQYATVKEIGDHNATARKDYPIFLGDWIQKRKGNNMDKIKALNTPRSFKTGDIVVAKNERRAIEGMKNIYIYLNDGWVLRVPYYVIVRSECDYVFSTYTYNLINADIATWISIDELEYASHGYITEHDRRAKTYYVAETLNDWFGQLMKKKPEKKHHERTNITVHHMVCARQDLHGYSLPWIEKRYDKYPTLNGNFIKKVIFSDPATIIFWEDGTKTVVKTQDGEEYDKEKGFAMAVCKKIFGNERDYYNVFKRWMRKGEERHEET